MRILLAPVYDLGRVGVAEGDSQFLWSRTLARTMTERGHFVYWVMPSGYPDPVLPRTKVLRFQPPETRQMGQFVLRNMIPAELLAQLPDPIGPSFIDMAITNDAYYGLLLQQAFASRRFLDWTPILLFDNYPTALGWEEQDFCGPHPEDSESMLYARALGYALCEPIGCSPWSLGRMSEIVRLYAPAPLVERFLKRRTYIFPQVDTRYLDSFHEEKNPKFSLYWGGRFTATKGGEKSLEQYLKFVMGGRDAEIYITAVGGAMRGHKVLRKYGGHKAIHLFYDLNFEMANRIQKRCHAAVFYQLNPGAGAPYYWLYNGLVVLMKSHGFKEELEQMPPDYPFWFASDDECATMLRWVYENYDEAQAKLASIGCREWLRTKVDEQDEYVRMVTIGERRVAEHKDKLIRQRYDDDTRALLARVLDALDPPVTLPFLIEAAEKSASRRIFERDFNGAQHFSMPMRVYRYLIPEGWMDDCETEIPRYVRRPPAAEIQLQTALQEGA